MHFEFDVTYRSKMHRLRAEIEYADPDQVLLRVHGKKSSVLFEITGKGQWGMQPHEFCWIMRAGSFNMPHDKYSESFEKELFAKLKEWVLKQEWPV